MQEEYLWTVQLRERLPFRELRVPLLWAWFFPVSENDVSFLNGFQAIPVEERIALRIWGFGSACLLRSSSEQLWASNSLKQPRVFETRESVADVG
jgi:hypothetical protein